MPGNKAVLTSAEIGLAVERDVIAAPKIIDIGEISDRRKRCAKAPKTLHQTGTQPRMNFPRIARRTCRRDDTIPISGKIGYSWNLYSGQLVYEGL